MSVGFCWGLHTCERWCELRAVGRCGGLTLGRALGGGRAVGAGPQVLGCDGQEQGRSWGGPFAPRLASACVPGGCAGAIPWDSLAPARPSSAAAGS